MITATLQEAKAKLNQLVEKAQSGEEVVLMRGTEIVATILPISSREVEISSRLTDTQAKKFWDEVGKEKKQTFKNAQQAIKFLNK
jgi:antitoxin (DNA-binding transcriptional repressor) of toxin-antitoxin stability system